MATRRRRRSNPRRLSRHQVRVRAGRKAARTRKRRRHVVAFANPRRRRYHHHMRMRRYRSNPRFGLGGESPKKLAIGAGIGAVGAVGIDYIWQYLSANMLSAYPTLQSGYVGTAAKAAVALVAGWGASKVIGKPMAVAATGGALTVIAYQLLHQLIATNAPTAAIPATTTAATPAMSGVAAYMPHSMAGVHAYMPHSMGRLGWVSPGTPLRGLGRARGPGWNPVTPPNVRPGGSISSTGLAMPGGY